MIMIVIMMMIVMMMINEMIIGREAEQGQGQWMGAWPSP